MKEELLQIFPKPVLILPYENKLDKELEFIRTLEWILQKANGNFKSKDTYILKKIPQDQSIMNMYTLIVLYQVLCIFK